MKRVPFLPHLLAVSKTEQIFVLQVRRTLDGHGAADVLVGCLDLGAGEPDMAQQIETGLAALFLGDADARHGLVTERPDVEGEPELEDARQRRVDLVDIGVGEALRLFSVSRLMYGAPSRESVPST